MKLLLDTNIWVWAILEPHRLSRRVTGLLASTRSELWLSAVSPWEVSLGTEKRRMRLDRPAELWIENALAELPLKDAVLTRQVATESRRLTLDTEDPADRFIAATARVYDLTLVTADEKLRACKGISTIGND